MKLETPGKRQPQILEALYFSLPHKPLAPPASLSSGQLKEPLPIQIPRNEQIMQSKKNQSRREYSDDEEDNSSNNYTEDEEMSEEDEQDSDAMEEPLSDTEDDGTTDDDYDEEIIEDSGKAPSPPQKPKKAAPSPKTKSKQSLSSAMRKKDLFGASKDSAKEKDIPPFPLAKETPTPKTNRLSAGSKISASQELIPIGRKAAVEKKQARLNFQRVSPSSPKAQNKPKPKPKPKLKPKSKLSENAHTHTEPEESFEASLQTKKVAKMENGTYRGKTAYIVHRGNLSSKYIIQIPRRGRKNHPVLGKPDKMPTLTEQVRKLSDQKQLRFRDLTYVYIHVDNGKGETGVFVAGLFTSSGSITHVNATTIELPAYKELYAEEGGTSHRQAKIKDVITSCNKQKGTNFVLQLVKESGSEDEAVELQLPFLSTQAYQSIVNEDRRVTKQRQNKDAASAKNAVSAMAKATKAAVESTRADSAKPPAATESTKPTEQAKGKRKRGPAPPSVPSGADPDSPVVWPLSKKKRQIFGNIMAKIHENNTREFAVAAPGGNGQEKIYKVKMEIDSVTLI